MSDPTPEDLYEALRKRLADYGQEPPPDLWAGIRQQLPPPVAVPRRRRWRAGVVLSLVLVVASLATWQWQRAGTVTGQSDTVAQRTVAKKQVAASANTASEHSANEQGVRIASAPGAAPAGPGLGEAAGKQGASGSASSGTAPNATTQHESANINLNVRELASSNPVTKPQKLGTINGGSTAKPVSPAVALATKPTGRPTRLKRALALAGIERNASEARQQRLLRSTRGARFGQSATSLAQPSHESTLKSAASQHTAAAPRSQAASTAASAAKVAEAAGVASSRAAEAPKGAPTAGVSSSYSSASRRMAGTANQPAEARPTAPVSAQSLVAVQPGAARPDVAQPGGWDWLALRVAGLQLPAALAPPTAPQPVAVASLPSVVPAVVARWAVQLVAGPGLTYRHLGTASGLSYSATNSLSTPSAAPVFSAANPIRIPTTNTTTTSSVAELERPALGYGAQLSIRRTLTPHWTVSSGLGYAEYATALALRQVSAAQITRANYNFNFLDSLSRTSGTTIRQRDTYRFLTVPVRAGYVWTTGPRWQVGLLGGVDAAIYLGGTSTEGSACGCQPQTWGASGSPYRSLSLAASLGAEVRYRLAGPWQLLAQPTASYMLTPLAKPVSGYSSRHLLGGTALLGVSYDLP
ncbi:hypothetical protein Q5H92_16965 [Hymenobacter sp. M29]|uniref:Outer membrane protein beta-barrel domain-containing protein n=1 Tax=Hymenobacter mellowenesis TaxID=3063995 RepID=A0ABT9AFC9_9BACT|nr:hypothetical protein [Hymenobacter sp. M29]MDO7848059.1 hypothetical protein [Hymenobacter sp. M29]